LSERYSYERAAWAATELGLQRDELERRLSLAMKAVSSFYDDHGIEGDPPCACVPCEKARAAFQTVLEPLPTVPVTAEDLTT
jgi:hypothetical protein